MCKLAIAAFAVVSMKPECEKMFTVDIQEARELTDCV